MMKKKWKFNNPLQNTAEVFSFSDTKGVALFKGTDIPVSYLWSEFLAGGSIDDFLTAFPSVEKEDVLSTIRYGLYLVEASIASSSEP